MIRQCIEMVHSTAVNIGLLLCGGEGGVITGNVFPPLLSVFSLDIFLHIQYGSFERVLMLCENYFYV